MRCVPSWSTPLFLLLSIILPEGSKGSVMRGLGFNGVQLTSYCLWSRLRQLLAVLGQHTGGIGYSGLSEAFSILTVANGKK